jgi:hypothetical protein
LLSSTDKRLTWFSFSNDDSQAVPLYFSTRAWDNVGTIPLVYVFDSTGVLITSDISSAVTLDHGNYLLAVGQIAATYDGLVLAYRDVSSIEYSSYLKLSISKSSTPSGTTDTVYADSKGIIAGFDYSTYALTVDETHSFDSTFAVRIFNFDGSQITISAPGWQNTSTSQWYGSFRTGVADYADTVVLTEKGEWVDIAYDKNAEAFQVTATSPASAWVGAVKTVYENGLSMTNTYQSSIEYMTGYSTDWRTPACATFGSLLTTTDTRFALTDSAGDYPNRLTALVDAIYDTTITINLLLRSDSALPTDGSWAKNLQAKLYMNHYPYYILDSMTIGALPIVPPASSGDAYYIPITLTGTTAVKTYAGDVWALEIDNPYYEASTVVDGASVVSVQSISISLRVLDTRTTVVAAILG